MAGAHSHYVSRYTKQKLRADGVMECTSTRILQLDSDEVDESVTCETRTNDQESATNSEDYGRATTDPYQ